MKCWGCRAHAPWRVFDGAYDAVSDPDDAVRCASLIDGREGHRHCRGSGDDPAIFMDNYAHSPAPHDDLG